MLFLEINTLGREALFFEESENNVDRINGFRIEVHEGGTLPCVKLSGRNIMPGTSTDIIVKQTKQKKIGGRYGSCTKRKFLKSLKSYTYSKSRCIDVCKSHYIFDKCGCVSSDIPLTKFLIENNATYCGKLAAYQIQALSSVKNKIVCVN